MPRAAGAAGELPPALHGVAARAVVTFTAPYGVFRWLCGVCRDEDGDIYAVIARCGSDGTRPGRLPLGHRLSTEAPASAWASGSR